MNLSWFIANRIGTQKGKLGGIGNVIAISSVAISIVVIVLASAISNGFRKEIREKALAYTGDLTIKPYEDLGNREGQNSFKIDSLSSLDKIKELPFVKNVQGVSFRPGMIKTDEQIQGIILKGVDENYDWGIFEKSLVKGELPISTFSNLETSANSETSADSRTSTNYVLVSDKICSMLNLNVGESIILYFIVDNQVKLRKFIISGIYSVQFEKFDQIYLFTQKRVVNELNGWGEESVNSYQIDYYEHSDKEIDKNKEAIIQTLYTNITPSDGVLSVESIKDQMSQLFDWLHLIDMNVVTILILMILVAGFNMVSSLLIILFENISKIGLLKTIGMKNGKIKNIFLSKSAKIILYGILIGDGVAILICTLQKYFKIIRLNPDTYFLDSVPIDYSIGTILATDAICFIAIMTILLLPCHFISKIEPAKTVKFQ